MKLPSARFASCLLAALTAAPGHAEPSSNPPDHPDVHRAARAGAVADSVSTLIGATVTQLGAEANPLVGTTPAGLAALLVGKLGLIRYVETQPDAQHDQALRRMAAAWSGMSANNLAIAAGSGPLAIPLGLLAGYMVYQYEDPGEGPHRHDLGRVDPLPPGVRAADANRVGQLRLAVVRSAGLQGPRDALLHHELAVLAPDPGIKPGDMVEGPDGRRFVVDQLLGEIPVTEVGRTQALVADEPDADPKPAMLHQVFVVQAWVHSYAARRALPDGGADPDAPEVRIALEPGAKAQPGQLVQQSDGQRYAILRPLGVHPIGSSPGTIAPAQAESRAHTGHDAPPDHQVLEVSGWRYVYAARLALPDGSPDPAAPEVRIEPASRARAGQILLHSDGQRYAILRPLGAYPVPAKHSGSPGS